MAFSFDTEGVAPQPSSALKAGLRSSTLDSSLLTASSQLCTAVPCTLHGPADLQATWQTSHSSNSPH